MPSLPASTAFTNSAVTEGGFKTAITNQREFLADLLGTTGTKLNAVRTLGTLANDVDVKTGAYTVIAADMGKLLLCSGTFTVSLTAAATLGDGFSFIIENNGTGVITIDPNSTEQIDGVATKTLAAGDWCVVTCTGTGFNTFGYSVSMTLLATVTATSGNSVNASGLDLTPYKALKIYSSKLSNNSPSSSFFVAMSSDNSQSSAYQITQAGVTTFNLDNVTEVDLTNSVYASTSAVRVTSSIIAVFGGTTNISSSSTIIYFRWSGSTNYNNANGKILIYGVK